jgi:hypothetical protein
MSDRNRDLFGNIIDEKEKVKSIREMENPFTVPQPKQKVGFLRLDPQKPLANYLGVLGKPDFWIAGFWSGITAMCTHGALAFLQAVTKHLLDQVGKSLLPLSGVQVEAPVTSRLYGSGYPDVRSSSSFYPPASPPVEKYPGFLNK